MIDLSHFKTKTGKIVRHGKEIEVGTLPSTTKPKRRNHLFAKVPLLEAAAACKATEDSASLRLDLAATPRLAGERTNLLCDQRWVGEIRDRP